MEDQIRFFRKKYNKVIVIKNSSVVLKKLRVLIFCSKEKENNYQKSSAEDQFLY